MLKPWNSLRPRPFGLAKHWSTSEMYIISVVTQAPTKTYLKSSLALLLPSPLQPSTRGKAYMASLSRGEENSVLNKLLKRFP